MNGLDIDQGSDVELIAPGKEIPDSSAIGFTGVDVPDIGREELYEALSGRFAFVSDEPGQYKCDAVNLEAFADFWGCWDEF